MKTASLYSPWSDWSQWAWRMFYWKSAAHAWAVTPFARFFGPRGDGFGVITYHRVAPPPRRLPAAPLNVTPTRFRQQLAGLLERGYLPHRLTELIERQRRGAAIPRKAFAVVFDDGFENVYRHAFPVLQELQIPATIFMPTAYLDSPEPFPFDDWPAAGSPIADPATWRPLSTAQCQEMLDGRLIDLGSHTHAHQDFRGRLADFESDLTASLTVLRERFEQRQIALAFPFGFMEPEFKRAAQRLGVNCCLNCDCRLVTRQTEPMDWGRFGAEQFDNSATLAAKLDGWYSAARAVWRTLKRRTRPHQSNRSPTPAESAEP